MSCPARGGQRTVLAPSGHASDDELRIAREQHVGAESQPLDHARPEAFDQRVRALGERERGRLPRLGLEIQRHRAPAAQHHVVPALAIQTQARVGTGGRRAARPRPCRPASFRRTVRARSLRARARAVRQGVPSRNASDFCARPRNAPVLIRITASIPDRLLVIVRLSAADGTKACIADLRARDFGLDAGDRHAVGIRVRADQVGAGRQSHRSCWPHCGSCSPRCPPCSSSRNRAMPLAHDRRVRRMAIGVLQFGLLFLGMKLGMPAGSVVARDPAAGLLHDRACRCIRPEDRLHRWNVVGALIAAVLA